MFDQAIERAKSGEVVVLDENEFRALLQDSLIVFQENTYISDMIRILEWYGTVLVQEMTDEKQIIIRAMPTIEQARTFVSRRRDTYEACGTPAAARSRTSTPDEPRYTRRRHATV